MSAKNTYSIPEGMRERTRAAWPTTPCFSEVNIHESARISDTCHILGDITIGKDVSVFYGSSIRGDISPIVIGDECNIQENCTLHVHIDESLIIGEHTTIGHGCLLHGCTIGDNCLVGMGSLIMNGCKIGNNCLVGAGSLLTEGTVIPDRHMALGRPAKVVRELTDAEIADLITQSGEDYLATSEHLLAEGALFHPTPELLRKIGVVQH